MPKKRNEALASDIGRRLHRRRKELNLTQEQVAERAGLSQQYYACIERGLKGIGAESIVRICRALEISADCLLTGAMPDSDRQYILKMFQMLDERQQQAGIQIMKNLLTACGYEAPEN